MENKKIIISGKLLLIGLITTIVRIIGQMFIPSGTQDILKPSIFVNKGIMPLVFTVYGILAYTIIALMFLLVKEKICGVRVIRGLKYAVSCCLVWVVYLFEPLPHVAFIDKFTYPIADSIALLVLGILSGLLLCEKEKNNGKKSFKIYVFPILVITVLFTLGRYIQYEFISIYSSYADDKIATIVWAIFVGLIISLVVQWLNDKLVVKKTYIRSVILGVVLFGVDLILFNFFMPLVFDADIPDLIIRTAIDIVFVTIGCFFTFLKPMKERLEQEIK